MQEPLDIGPWKRISILGSGAFGVVTLWQNVQNAEYIAIKKCRFITGGQLTTRQKERWINEVDIMKRIECPTIVPFKALPQDLESTLRRFNPTKLPLLSMEYCQKGNLRHVLTQPRNFSGLPENEVRTVLEDVANAVAYLHNLNITHRDIKPENIVLGVCNSRPGGLIYKIIDLGYAKELNDTVISFVGTLNYLAPEIMITESYNYSVDYWSLGIVAFEIVCGVLPFLPQLTPLERFQYIEKKNPEVICIYQMQSGGVASSLELLKENNVSSWLKPNLEAWLKHVLQFDPELRGQTFPGDINVFNYLLNILKRKVVTVFSVPTLEFYSYEINDSTLIGTLKDWIARDTKVKRCDQVLLSEEKNEIADEKCIIDVMSSDFFVYKKGVFINKEIFTLPKYVKTLFQNCTTKYTWRNLRNIYVKCLYFLCQEEKLIKTLLLAFKLYNSYVRSLNEKLKSTMVLTHEKVGKLIGVVDEYQNLRENNFNKSDSERKESYKSCLEDLQELMNRLEHVVQSANTLIKDVDSLTKRQITMDETFLKVKPVIDNLKMSMHVEKACELLLKSDSQNSMEMVKLVSTALKEKDKLLLNNNNFRNYTRAISIAIRDAQILLGTLEDFTVSVQELSQDIDNNRKKQLRLLLNEKPKKKEVSLSNFLFDSYDCCDTDALISENARLLCRFEEALEQAFTYHKQFFDKA